MGDRIIQIGLACAVIATLFASLTFGILACLRRNDIFANATGFCTVSLIITTFAYTVVTGRIK